MSDDFQRGLQARLAHLIGEASQWSRGSGAHPPGLVKALNEAFEYGCAEIKRLRQQRDELRAALRNALPVLEFEVETRGSNDLLYEIPAGPVLDAARAAIARAEVRSDGYG